MDEEIRRDLEESADSAREESKKEKSRQRRIPYNNVGLNRNAIVPEEDVSYDPPGSYPDLAQRYLGQLARIGTMTGACKLAGTSPLRVYEWRTQLEGFYDEEEAAKDALTDYLEENLFDAVFTEVGMARVKALEVALKANRSKKYNPAQKHQVDGEVGVTWIELLKEQENK